MLGADATRRHFGPKEALLPMRCMTGCVLNPFQISTEALFSAVGHGCFKFLDQLLQFGAVETSHALHWRYYTTEFETCFHSWHCWFSAGVGLLYTAIVLMAPSIPELPKSADPVEPR